MATLGTYLAQLEHLPLDDAEDVSAARARFSADDLLRLVTAKITIMPRPGRRSYLKVQLLDPQDQELCCFAGLLPHAALQAFIDRCKLIEGAEHTIRHRHPGQP
jgi:hypothetical protein